MLNAKQARARLEKLAPKTYVEAYKVYRTFDDGLRKDTCEIWIGSDIKIHATKNTFEGCLEEAKDRMGN